MAATYMMLKIKLENFKKCLKQKRCGMIRLNVPNLLHFCKKFNFYVKKSAKNSYLLHFVESCTEFTVFCIFSLKD